MTNPLDSTMISMASFGDLSSMRMFTVPAVAIHRVLHAGTEPAVTIHAYSPPLRRTGAYAVTPDGILQRTAVPYEIELRAELALAAGSAR